MQGSGFKLQNYFSMLGIHVNLFLFCKYSLFTMCQALLGLRDTVVAIKENLSSQSLVSQSVSSVAQLYLTLCDPSSPQKMPVYYMIDLWCDRTLNIYRMKEPVECSSSDTIKEFMNHGEVSTSQKKRNEFYGNMSHNRGL